MLFKVTVLSLAFLGVAWGYGAGAPEDVCEDMIPQHGVDPQKSALPYTISVDKPNVKAGDKVKITISGGKPFKGFLLQVRDGSKAVGSFAVDSGDKFSHTINCFGSAKNSVTHKSADVKPSVSVHWVPPQGKKTYTVYATVAENGGVFWVHQPTAKISVN